MDFPAIVISENDCSGVCGRVWRSSDQGPFLVGALGALQNNFVGGEGNHIKISISEEYKGTLFP